jgi:transcription elongation factor Elf1
MGSAMEVIGMFTFACPWCDHELAVDRSEHIVEVRCDDCATVVDLAPEPVAPTVTLLAA